MIRLVVFAIAFLFVASSVHAQLPPGPVLLDGGVCLPGNTIVPTPPCILTVVAPTVSDLVCVRFVNVKRIETINLPVNPNLNPMGLDCISVAPGQQFQVEMSRPALGEGSILFRAVGDRAVGQTASSMITGIVADVSFVRFFALAICPTRALDPTIPKPDPICPPLGNDIAPGEFPDF